METLAALLTAVQPMVLLLLLVAGGGWVIRIIVRQRRGLVMVGRIETLDPAEAMGLEVQPGGGDWPGLTLIATDTPEATVLRLDTSRKAGVPDQLQPLEFGVQALDARFAVRAADDGARQGLEAARAGALQIAGDFLDGWAARFSRISVGSDRVHFAFGPNQVHHLEKVLPQLAWLAKVLLSAAWWHPPGSGLSTSRAAFRGGGANVAPSAPIWHLEVPRSGHVKRAGPFSLEQIIELLQHGRISWLTRASMEASGSLAPLLRQPSLQPLCFATRRPDQKPRAEATSQHGQRPRRGGWRPGDILQFDLVVLLLLAVLAISNCQAGPDFVRAARGEQSVSWPAAAAEIVHSRIATRQTAEDTYYWPDIRYRYQVGGQQLTGRRWRYRYIDRFGGYSSDRADVEQAVARYRVGQKVSVSYDPNNPSESVLEPGLFRVELVSAVIKACFTSATLLLLIVVSIARVRASLARRRARRAMFVEPPSA